MSDLWMIQEQKAMPKPLKAELRPRKLSNTFSSQVCGRTCRHRVQIQPGEAQVALKSLVRTFKHSWVLDEKQKMHTLHLNEPGSLSSCCICPFQRAIFHKYSRKKHLAWFFFYLVCMRTSSFLQPILALNVHFFQCYHCILFILNQKGKFRECKITAFC